MMSNRQMLNTVLPENQLWLSWHDTQMMAGLSPQTVMDYFCRKSNPFYDRICNNETVRMQRLTLDHLNNMTGIEYILLHVAEPILYVIRKQHRYSPTEATPLADYYIIGGHVYRAPDLASVINSRILNTVTNLQVAFEEASSYSRYHPNKGYTFDFSSNKTLSEKLKTSMKKDGIAKKDESGTAFQTQRVDMLLAEVVRKFPPPLPQIPQQQAPNEQQDNTQPNNSNPETSSITGPNTNIEPKTESADMKPPPEKKIKIER